MGVRSLVLGLDVSPKRMGWGLVDLETGDPIACGCEDIDLPSGGWKHQQVARAFDSLPSWGIGGLRNDERSDDEIQLVYIEQPGLPPVSGTKSAYNAGRAVQAVHGEVERRWPWAPIEYLQPSEWRVLAGLKGNASKDQVRRAAHYEALGADWSEDRCDFLSGSQDAADALLIALAGQRRNQDTWDRGQAA